MFLTICVCCLVVAFFLFGWQLFHREQAQPRISVSLNMLVFAFNQAREHLGDYPTGSWQQVSSLLTGDNVKKLRFINGIRTNQFGELLDFWGTPYSYEISSNLVIKSAGPDGLFGSQDDKSATYP